MLEAGTRARLSITEDHLAVIKALVLPPDGHEGAALFLCGWSAVQTDPWNGKPSIRFVSREIVPISPEDIVESSDVHITVRTASLARTLKRARNEQLVVGYIHSHPNGPARFSAQDDGHEPYMAELARNRNGINTPFLSLLVTGDGQLVGRVWTADAAPVPFETIHVIGDRFGLHYSGRLHGGTPNAFHRQMLAFGPALIKDLAELRFGVVGAGATGSATIAMLTRLGARRIAIFDKDVVDETNLNRLHGATRADIGKPKVEVLKAHVEAMGLEADVRAYPGWVGDSDYRDVLKSCDIIFGCTDDNEGRMLLNRLAYFYLIPIIDMGIDIDLGERGIIGADARVTVVLPGTRCLLCRNIIDPQRAYEEHLARSDPEEYARRVEEKYVRGGGNPAPAVVHLTTDVAAMAIDELIHRLTGYRRRGALANRVRKFLLAEDKTPGAPVQDYCPLCGVEDYWGRGDTEPFLDRVG